MVRRKGSKRMSLKRWLDGSMVLENPASHADFCEFVAEWQVTETLAAKAMALGCRFTEGGGFALRIISGGRTCEQQNRLRAAGRPAASCARSTHVLEGGRLATGFDIATPTGVGPPGSPSADLVWRTIGALAQLEGLRWGGGSDILVSGVPTDPNHFDLGPREVTG